MPNEAKQRMVKVSITTVTAVRVVRIGRLRMVEMPMPTAARVVPAAETFSSWLPPSWPCIASSSVLNLRARM